MENSQPQGNDAAAEDDYHLTILLEKAGTLGSNLYI